MFEGWTNDFAHFTYTTNYKSNPFNIVDFFMNNPIKKNFIVHKDEGFYTGMQLLFN